MKIKSLPLLFSFLLSFGSLLVFTIGSSFLGVSSARTMIEANGMDCIAGNPSIITSSVTVPKENVYFQIKNPLGEIYSLSSMSSSEGIAKVELDSDLTEKAVKYIVSAKLGDSSEYGQKNYFTVYPGKVSLSNSLITPENQVVNSLTEKAEFLVRLADDFGNPVEGHKVRLISTSINDEIKTVNSNNISNSSGEVKFKVSNSQNETVTYSVYNTTEDKLLKQKAKVVYFDDSNKLFSNNFSPTFASMGNSAGPINEFKFEDIPDTIYPGRNISFTLTAYDINEEIVTNYEGEVTFSVETANSQYVKLPEDYTFTPEDRGSHTFSLALLFQRADDYIIKVQDVDNEDIYSEKLFIVTDESPPLNDIGDIVITNPLPGTYSNNIQTIKGTAEPGARLKIFDNDIEIVSLTADVNGDFSYTAGPLTEGEHNIYVARVNEVGTIIDTSEVVTFNIDAEGPEVLEVILDPPESVEPGGAVNVEISVNKDLSRAEVVIDGNVFELRRTAPQTYEAVISAPIEFGTYELNFNLTDELGNRTSYENSVTLNVTPDGSLTGVGPSMVLNLIATPGDKRVTLNWTKPTDNPELIKNYRVYYGTSPERLIHAVDTFTDATTWYIPDLENNVEYYFAVAAVDIKGNISEQFEKIVSSIPRATLRDVVEPDIENGIEGEDVLDEMEDDLSDVGPEMLWLVFASIVAGYFYQRKRRVFCKNSIEDIV